jgi:hypothetical protein
VSSADLECELAQGLFVTARQYYPRALAGESAGYRLAHVVAAGCAQYDRGLSVQAWHADRSPSANQV